MNIFTKTVLSLSLVALIAQPVHIKAASCTDRVKKAGKIAFHTMELVLGYKCARIVYPHLKLKMRYRSEQVLVTRSKNALLYGTPISAILLYHGIKGLKQEICPDFNPIAWMKNKLSNKTQQPA